MDNFYQLDCNFSILMMILWHLLNLKYVLYTCIQIKLDMGAV